MRYELAQRSKGANPEKWRDTTSIAIPDNQLDTMIADRYGVAQISFLRDQLAQGRVIELAWGYLRQQPTPGGDQ